MYSRASGLPGSGHPEFIFEAESSLSMYQDIFPKKVIWMACEVSCRSLKEWSHQIKGAPLSNMILQLKPVSLARRQTQGTCANSILHQAETFQSELLSPRVQELGH
jgi:hypothetical protein